MNLRTLAVLAVIALVGAGIALWSISDRAPQQDVGLQGALLPSLTARLNDVEQVRIVGAGSVTLATLDRRDGGWELAERDGYPVDGGKVRGLLISLADAQKVEAKTANPEMHDRIGVEDVSAAEAQGVRVDIIGGGPDMSVILGDNNSRGKGTYVRLDGEAASWLVDLNIAVERKPVEWLQRELVNVPTSRVAKVSIVPAQGPAIEIAREAGAGGDFQLQNLPRGRESASEFVADATAGLLDSLRFDDVVSSGAVTPATEGARTATFTTFEGLSISVNAWKADGKTYAAMSAKLDEAAADAWASASGAETDAVSEDKAAPSAATKSASADTLSPADKRAALDTELDTLQTRFANRVFVLPAFKASNLERDLDAYLKPTS